MIIYLYKINEAPNKLVKTLGAPESVNASPYGPINIEAPEMLLGDEAIDYNYAFVPAYGKYYFVREPSLDANGLVVYPFEVDPLMSNAAEILNLDVTIERQERNFNEYIADGTFVPDSREFIEVVNFEDGFNENGELILITAGGAATI